MLSTLRGMGMSYYKALLGWLTYPSQPHKKQENKEKAKMGARVLRALDCCGHSHPVCFPLALQGLDSCHPGGTVPLSSALVSLSD